MTFGAWPTISALREVFQEEVSAIGARVVDVYDDADASRLYMRAVLPKKREVKKSDRLQGGVAMRATDASVHVHPYTYRVVCRNGAIAAHATQTRVVLRDDVDLIVEPDVIVALRAAVRQCCSPESFDQRLLEMRGALEIEADQMLALMPWVRGFPKHLRATFLSQFFENVPKEPNRASRFGLMQAITAVARDTADPEVRWRLEEFGGGVPVMRQPDPDPRPLAVTRRRARTSTEPSRAYNEMALSGGLLVE